MMKASKKESKPAYFSSCLGLRSHFWEVADGGQIMLTSATYSERLCLIAIDEAHCIQSLIRMKTICLKYCRS